jgi:peptidoglycan/LPS O-acetylase OafA/YrhL
MRRPVPHASRRYQDLTPARRRRLEAVLLARSVIVGVLLVAAYYLLPLDKPEDFGVALLVGGLILVAAVVAWQVRAIQNSPFPRLRGFQTLISGIPLLLVVFAAVYYLTGQAQADSFTQPMDKIDAMYFTVTVFSTVGFGDITAKTDLARTLVTVQMLVNLVVIGLVAKVIFGAVDTGVKKRTAEQHEPSEPPAADRN